MTAICPDRIEHDHDPLEIDSRPCEHCGLLLDDHFTIDGPEGPEHFCQPLDVALQLRALRLQEIWERADSRDRWRHTGEAPPEVGIPTTAVKQPYRTPPSVIDAFKYVVRTYDAAYLKDWLERHPRDASFLIAMLRKDAGQ